MSFRTNYQALQEIILCPQPRPGELRIARVRFNRYFYILRLRRLITQKLAPSSNRIRPTINKRQTDIVRSNRIGSHLYSGQIVTFLSIILQSSVCI